MAIDPVTLAVMANRLDGVTREMTNTMVRAARSTTMAGRDFSCSITSSDNDLVSCPEGIPVHVFGSTLISAAMQELHPDFREGDAFMTNDPYRGNSHAADQTILVPVFFKGEHVFTACAKAHQADIGNAIPTTYSPKARDVYEEGALIFPCVRIQRDYRDNIDIIRMCERRIRSFETWHGDYLATLGATRLAERRLKEFCSAFGVENVRAFVNDWLNYCERMAADAISKLPAARIIAQTCLDPYPRLPDGLLLKATIDVHPEAGKVVVDLRDNPDCTPTGLNLSESTSKNSATTAVLMVLNSKRDATEILVPNNSGTYRRIEVLLRENCVVGIPRHPVSTSNATSTLADRVVGMIISGLAALGEGVGAAEPCYGAGPYQGVVSGNDRRRGGAPYIFQILSGTDGGPATFESDGWLTFLNTGSAGIGYVDSTEIVEQKYPLVVWEKVVRPDSEGAGRTRGGLGNVSIYGPRFDDMWCHYSLDGVVNRPRGVRGGGSPQGSEAWLVREDGRWDHIVDAVGEVLVKRGESIVSLSGGGGGYGAPIDRDPGAVLSDVIEGHVSVGRAREAYGVVIRGDPSRYETLAVDVQATAELRERLTMESQPDFDARRQREEPCWWIGTSS